MPEGSASSRIEPMNSELSGTSFLRKRETPKVEYGTPLIRQWFDRCVMCLRCIQACVDIPGADVLEVAERGSLPTWRPFERRTASPVENVFGSVPVGALTENLSPIKGRTWQLSRVQTTCAFCPCGCQLELNSLANRLVVNVTTKRKRVSIREASVSGDDSVTILSIIRRGSKNRR